MTSLLTQIWNFLTSPGMTALGSVGLLITLASSVLRRWLARRRLARRHLSADLQGVRRAAIDDSQMAATAPMQRRLNRLYSRWQWTAILGILCGIGEVVMPLHLIGSTADLALLAATYGCWLLAAIFYLSYRRVTRQVERTIREALNVKPRRPRAGGTVPPPHTTTLTRRRPNRE